MNDIDPSVEDLEQHRIAVDILFGLLTLSLDKPGTLNRDAAASLLQKAADERDRQGDYQAAQMLDEWAEMLGEPEEGKTEQ
jgi:hypothetical protein